MAKYTVFEEILESELRWPKPGDAPFVVADDPLENANVAEDQFTRLVLMMEGYKKAADLMVAQANGDEPERHYLVCPIIFNYRQYIELHLKCLIATYGHTVDVKANWRDHDLITLWKSFQTILERYGTADPDSADPVVQTIVAEFAKIDPNSYSYRYPVDRSGNALPLAYKDLHLPTLADVMNGVAGYFTGCDGYLVGR